MMKPEPFQQHEVQKQVHQILATQAGSYFRIQNPDMLGTPPMEYFLF